MLKRCSTNSGWSHLRVNFLSQKQMPIALRSLLLLALLLNAAAVRGVEHITFRRDGKEEKVSGKPLVKAQDGGMMLMSPDGQLWTIQPDEIVEQKQDDAAFAPLTPDAIGKQLLETLPEGFEGYRTQHYVICHNTSRAYAQWCGMLFERLYAGFMNFWRRKGFELHEPEMPLVVIAFADQRSYERWAEAELGPGTQHVIAYYSLRTNRVTMFDLTGEEALRAPGGRRGTTAQINQILARPEAQKMLSTIVHEATHQIAFNCGLQQRYADIPLWVSEGVAVYFEAPDLSSSKGWKTIGEVNWPRLRKFRQYLAYRPKDSIASLVVDDLRLRNPRQALDAYAEAWALNYFLIRQKPKEYTAYLKTLSQKEPLVFDEPEERLKAFKEAFGDLEKLDVEFLRHMQKVR